PRSRSARGRRGVARERPSRIAGRWRSRARPRAPRCRGWRGQVSRGLLAIQRRLEPGLMHQLRDVDLLATIDNQARERALEIAVGAGVEVAKGAEDDMSLADGRED